MVRVAVIGAGMVGVCSALNVQKELPGAHVTIIADKFGKDTTSFGAGGFFRPYMPDVGKGVDPGVAEQWVRDSWEYYSGLARSHLAAETGNALVPGLVAYTTPQDKGYELIKELSGDYRQLSYEQLQKMNLGRYKYGYAFTTVVSQTSIFLEWLMRKFQEAGGKVEKRTVQNLKDLSNSYDIVVNCCGLKARELLHDAGCFPIKGHIVMVHAPWQKQFFYSGDDIYLIPHFDKLIIGGIKDKGNYTTSVDSDVRQFILSRAFELFPQLKCAPIVGEWIGHRPGRESGVRLELELLDCGQGKKLSVVHNYGHGGHGITMGWGCGRHAARLAREASRGLNAQL